MTCLISRLYRAVRSVSLRSVFAMGGTIRFLLPPAVPSNAVVVLVRLLPPSIWSLSGLQIEAVNDDTASLSFSGFCSISPSIA